MRLLIKLRSAENTPYEMQYHHHLQALIYRLLKGGRYDYLHSKSGFKFFSFSNIFPFNELRENDLRNLIISSPDDDLISYLDGQLYNHKQIEVGKMKFKVASCDNFDVRIPDNGTPFNLITGTPIILRLRRDKYSRYYEHMTKVKNYDYVYWRIDHPIDLFVKQLEDNLIKKYNQYFGSNIKREPIFLKFLPPKKQISTRLGMSGNENKQVIVIGTTWEFMFEEPSPLLQFALDTGLGELNGLGFGFMNLKYTGESS